MEEEATQPSEQITIGNSLINVTKDTGGNIIKASGNITLDKLKELAEKSTNSVIINTDALTIKSFKTENNNCTVYTISKAALKKAAKALSVLNIENADITSISGDISLKDIVESSSQENTEITHYIAYNLKEKTNPYFDSTNLKINTFDKKLKGNSENVEWEYISTPITPQFLKETKLNALNKAILNFKDGGISVDVSFASYQGETEEQKQKDYFDITDFYNEVEKGKLQNIKNVPAENIKGLIFLKGNRETNMVGGVEDHTDYPKANELLNLINNSKLKDKIAVGSVQLAGNLKELLPYLVPGPNKIKEEDGGIIFGNANIIPCSGKLWTGFNGWISETQKESVLKIDELKELCKRTEGHSVYIRNAIIENLNSKDSNQIQDIIFLDSKLANISFKDSDLSKLEIEAQVQGNLEFENTILPKSMAYSITDNLILKNITLPKEQFGPGKEYEFADLPYNMLKIEDKLEIYGKIKNSIIQDLTDTEKQNLENGPKKYTMPKKYKGPQTIYDNLKKYLYSGESDERDFGNYQSSIQKQQSQLLALLQTQNKSRG